MTDRECVQLLQWALPRLGLRWPGYRKVRGRVRKRLDRRIRELGIGGAEAYRERLRSDASEWAILDGLCRIPISRFYRDRAVFDRLRDELLPRLAADAAARGESSLRCWSAGCASGEEPYTLALTIRSLPAERLAGLAPQIVATDADEVMIERARRACFGRGALRDLPAAWIEAGFVAAGDELCVREEVRSMVELRCEDIRRQMPDGPFRLVSCRNLVFTYFDASLQRALLERILARMPLGGLLVVGVHERPPEELPGLVRAAGMLPVWRRVG